VVKLRVKQFSEILSKNKLITILLVGILIRLILIPISAHPFDVYVWYNASTNIIQNGPLTVTVASFPPLWHHYFMIPIAYIYNWLSNFLNISAIAASSLPSGLNFYPSFGIQYIPNWLFNTIVKIPFLISDILIALLLYKIINQLTNKKDLAEKAALLWFLNPFVIFISAGWGTWDTLPALFSIAAFYFTLKKKYAISAIFFSLGVACKLYPLLFIAPLIIYILKTEDRAQKLKKSLIFFFIFLVFTLLLFLPYLGTISAFFSNYFLPTNATQTAVFSDQITSPLGFGLTYWAIFPLSRFFNFSISGTSISYVQIFSVILFIIALLLAYWKTTKLSFSNPAYGLAFTMFLPIAVLFLTYRIICEQFFVWLIPFFIILVISDKIKPSFFWSLSLIALLYAILNCPFPFFFLPLAPIGTNTLLGVVNFMLSCEPLRLTVLAISGTVFSILLLILMWQASKRI
jgi:hypothetical protein